MKVIVWVEVACDDCGHSLRRLTPAPLPWTPAHRQAEKRMFNSLWRFAARRGWRVEGPSVWAGDLCLECWRIERRKVGLEIPAQVRADLEKATI